MFRDRDLIVTGSLADEGFIEEEGAVTQLASRPHPQNMDEDVLGSPGARSVHDTEELAYKLLASLPRSRLATIQRRIAPLLQFDVVGCLPTEVSLQIFSYLPYQTLLSCGLVCHRWQALSNDQFLWKALCQARGWTWRHVPRSHMFGPLHSRNGDWDNSDDADDEGMGDSDEEGEDNANTNPNNTNTTNTPLMNDLNATGVEAAKAELTLMHAELDSGFASMSVSMSMLGELDIASSSMLSPLSPTGIASSSSHSTVVPKEITTTTTTTSSSSGSRNSRRDRHSAPSILEDFSTAKPNYKLLHQTHTKLKNRFHSSSYRLSPLQTRVGVTNAHTSTIYCLQLYTYPDTGKQVLFTGSRDRTVREWNLVTGVVERVVENVHNSSVLSICVHNGYLASAGSDRRVAVWHLETNKLVKTIVDHSESVLCVRFDDRRLVSCSKDRTVRTYLFPELEPQFVLRAHRAAVNAVSLSESFIVSASGDRSVRLWEAETGKLLRTFESHHIRGIASIDFCPPFVVSGSSDKHVRLFDMNTSQGWSTSPDHDYGHGHDAPPSTSPLHLPLAGTGNGHHAGGLVCQICGSSNIQSTFAAHGGGPADRYGRPVGGCHHTDLVRTVALSEEFVISGSYDKNVKVWDRKTGNLVANLTGGHTGRIFCIGFDSKKIVSCGEDQRICIWDFSHGIDTSFIP